MSISGPNAGIEALRLNGLRLTANLSNAVIGEPTIRRTIEGASELSLAVSDPERKLLRETFLDEAARVVLDDLRFTLVGVSKSGDDLTLTAEDETIYLLRQRTGPKKAFRDQITRAEFVKSLVRETLGDRVRFYSPELTVEQPVASEGKSRSSGSDPAPGISPNASGLTIKGEPATVTQKRNADRVIRLAMRYDPPRRAVVALLSACIVESVMGTYGMTYSTDGDSIGLLQARTSYVSREDALSYAYNVRRFMVEPWTGTSLGGAIEQARAGRAPGDIAQSIQGSAYPDRYALYVEEAQKLIDAYFGGEAGEFDGGGGQTKRYAFEVKKNEDYWTAIKRLAEEVNWRAFVVGPTFYFVSETTLLTGRRRMYLRDETRGVDSVDWEIDAGKRADSATVQARAGDWAAPPGTVAVLDESHGPARGKWIVSEIEGSLVNEDVAITLKRASKPKPEPAAEQVESDRGGSRSGEGSGGAEKMIRWAKATVGTNEGSARQRKWAAFAGLDYSVAWCAIWIGYGLKTTVGLDPPSGFPLVDNWFSWSNGKRVTQSSLKPGDLIIYDWGDGGITDHIALYIGNGRTIGGNESDSVLENDARLSSAVGFVRPYYPGVRRS